MNILYESLLQPSQPDLDQIERIYDASFPPAERKPFEHIVARFKRGGYYCAVARFAEDSTILGFALMLPMPGSSWVLLGYFAVDERYRGLSVGSKLLGFAIEYLRDNNLGQGVILEVEPPENDDPADEKNRRIRFYERLGGGIVELSAGFVMPNYETGQGGVPLLLMQLPLEKQPGKAEVAAMVTGIYAVGYAGWEELRDGILRGLEG